MTTFDVAPVTFVVRGTTTRYVGDITYVPIANGTNWYLATVIDLHSRNLVGWALAAHMRTELVTDALRMAHQVRKQAGGDLPLRPRVGLLLQGLRRGV